MAVVVVLVHSIDVIELLQARSRRKAFYSIHVLETGIWQLLFVKRGMYLQAVHRSTQHILGI